MRRVALVAVFYLLMGRSATSIYDTTRVLSMLKSEEEAIKDLHFWEGSPYPHKVDYILKIDEEKGVVEKLRLFTPPAPEGCAKECLIKL